jgi:hypothetical protein
VLDPRRTEQQHPRPGHDHTFRWFRPNTIMLASTLYRNGLCATTNPVTIRHTLLTQIS